MTMPKRLLLISFHFCLIQFIIYQISPCFSLQPNLLYIITDQQRFDAIRHVQNELPQYEGKLKINTPNMDRILKEGAYFRNAYTHTPVCAPARAVLRTGCTIERTGLQANKLTNKDVYDLMDVFKTKRNETVSIDQILSEKMGYNVEYYGKWHLPETHYFQSDGVTPAIKYNDYNYHTETFQLRTNEYWETKLHRYLHYDELQGLIKKEFKEGQQEDTYTRYPYTPVQLDARYGLPTQTSLSDIVEHPKLEGRKSQANVIGESSLGKDFTPIHYNGEIAVKALDRLAQLNEPFALTVSFHNPHGPMISSPEYLQYYWQNKEDLFVTPNIFYNTSNSAYSKKREKYAEMGYFDEQKLQEWIACYYAMIEEIDVYIGQLLDKLEQYGVAENTLIVFTSDHGEMLGSHGMRGKNMFYEEATHVPLAIVYPDAISPRTIVDEGVNHLDVFATILDYLGQGSFDESDGMSLRRFIENTSINADFDERVVVSEWDFREPVNETHLHRTLGHETNFMVMKGRYKLMMTKLEDASRLDMMFDIENDPFEMTNLVGINSNDTSTEVLGKAEHLKCLLVEWMQRMDGPGYYSKAHWSDSFIGPYLNDKVSRGDIVEINDRRKWPDLNLWLSDTELEFARPVWNGQMYVQNEYIYIGRSKPGELRVNRIFISGSDANLFTIGFYRRVIKSGICNRIKISYASNSIRDEVDASILIRYGPTRTIRIRMGNSISTYSPTSSSAPPNFNSLSRIPSSTPSWTPTSSQVPSSVISSRPSNVKIPSTSSKDVSISSIAPTLSVALPLKPSSEPVLLQDSTIVPTLDLDMVPTREQGWEQSY